MTDLGDFRGFPAAVLDEAMHSRDVEDAVPYNGMEIPRIRRGGKLSSAGSVL